MNNDASINSPIIAELPPVLDLRALEANFSIGKTTAYHLASTGEIQSLTLGAPGKRGKRAFLTSSVFDYIQRRLAQSTQLNCLPKTTPRPPSPSVKWVNEV